MATLLADPPAAPGDQQDRAAPAASAAPAGQLAARPCASCGAPMSEGQDWCFYCGAGARGSLASSSHPWRPAAALLAVVALLVVGAAAAAYAALTKSSPARRPLTALARAPLAGAATPGAAATPGLHIAPLSTVPKLGKPLKALAPLVKAPKTTLAPAGAKVIAPPPASTPAPATTTPATTPKVSLPASASPEPESQPSALLLDTDAASTYDPYGYPASNFGDPSLAIDGEPSTAWTALVEPAVAPRMAEGLLIDLKSSQRLAALVLVTSTPGMTVQVYGAATATAPSTITDPAWVRLSGLLVAKKHTTRIALAHSKQGFRFVTLWISQAPASAVGTPQAPGHVSVNEIELFPSD